MNLKRACLIINGADRFVVFNPQKDSLADLLRRIGLTGTKVGCGIGVCGACSVILNGEVVRSCTKKMKNVPEYSHITTIEGIGTASHLHPLQQAWITYGGVQCGFCSPGFIVSAKGLLDQNPNPTREEVRAWFQQKRNVCRCTGYKPLVDAVMAAAKVLRGELTMEDITYKHPEKASVYNTKLPRPSALSKVCGTCDYGDDIKLKMPPGTLHLAIVQPKITHHAKILNINYSEAEKMPGVVRILTAKDVQGTNRLDAYLTHKHAIGSGRNRPIIADEKIFRYGDVVAMVAADTEEHARAAAKAVKVEIEQLPEYLNFLDAAMPDAMRIHDQAPNVYIYQPLYKGEEDTRDVLDGSKHVVEGSFYTTRQPHMSIEPDIIQGYYDEDGMLTIQCKTQFIYGARKLMAAGIGITEDKLRVIENPVGGSFGWAVSPGSFALTAVCAMALKKPVTLSLSYEEYMHYSGKRAPAYINAKMGCDEEGKITAMEFDEGIDHGPYSEAAETLIDRFVRFIGFPYNIPNATGLARMGYTNHNFGVAYRSYGSPQTMTCLESMVDMLAEKAGMDRWEFRYRNVARPGDTTLNSYPYKQYPMPQILETIRPYYEAAMARAKAEDTPEKRRGVGLVCGGFSCSGQGADSAGCRLELNPDGSVSVFNTWQDIGQGGDIGTVTHVCESLREIGITPEKVRLCINDSKTCPNSGISGGSRSHYMNGQATILVAKKMLDAMRKPDGTYRTYDEMIAEGLPTKFEGAFDLSGYGLRPLDHDTGKGDPSPTYMYGAFLAEVEVEVKTGKTKVLSMLAVDDVGVVGNKLSVEGQAFGGMSHSIGFALSEDYDDVKKHTNMFAAGIPYIETIPDDFQVIHLENPRGDGPFGSAGCSELYQSSVHMAVINGIYHATGVRIYELPAAPEKVKAGLEKLAKGEKIQPKKYFLGSDMYDTLEELKEK